MNDLINVTKAAEILGVTFQAIYQNFRRGVLKYQKKDDKYHTTEAWIQEYRAAKDSRQLHSRFNGLPVFDESKGEYSLRQIGKMLGISEHTIYFHMKSGHYKGVRRGQYWMITEDQIPIIKAHFERHYNRKIA